MRRYLIPGALGALALAYPLLTMASPVYQRLGALVLLGAIGASAWNLIGGYAGQVSVGHAVFFGAGAYAAIGLYTHFGLPPIAGAPARRRGRGADRRADRRADAAAVRPLLLRWRRSRWPSSCACSSPTGSGSAPRRASSGPAVPRTVLDLSFTSAMPYYYLFLAVLAAILFLTWRIEKSRMGFYLRAIKDSERAARSLGVAAGRYKLYAYMLSAGPDRGRGLALCHHVRLRGSRSPAAASSSR